MRRLLALAAVLGTAATAPPAVQTPAEIVAAAPASAWAAIAPDNLLVMDLAGGRRVVIALAPDFAAAHVANIRALVRGHWFDANAVMRVQDDYVVQWGGVDEKKPLPAGVDPKPAAEYERPLAGLAFVPGPAKDVYAPKAGFVGGWPVGTDGRSAWLAHCYGMVGVGRDLPPDTGTGAELYAVIGHAPRHLDRNIALVGRVIEGMDALAALPRGTAELGFYKAPAERTAIVRVQMASDMPAADRPVFEEMRPAAPAFASYEAARANRRDPFFVRPAGAVDLCNVPVPTRRVP